MKFTRTAVSLVLLAAFGVGGGAEHHRDGSRPLVDLTRTQVWVLPESASDGVADFGTRPPETLGAM